MTDRERWRRVFRFQSVDHVPDMEFGYWKTTLLRWREEGFPAHIDTNEAAERYFGLCRRRKLPVSVGLYPDFEEEILGEEGEYWIRRNKEGAICRVRKDDPEGSIPAVIRYPIQTREDWLRFKERLDANTVGRYPPDWDRVCQEFNSSSEPVGIELGSLFGWIRDWMGLERLCFALYDDRTWVEEMMDHLVDLVLQVIPGALRDVRLDFGAFWEDMAYRNGPMISPRLFHELLVPRYRRITEVCRRHGLDLFYVDCDGNILNLIEGWLKAGISIMFPLEVRGGSDPVAIRQRFGRQVLLMGGVDKTKLIEGKRAIREEIRRLEPLVAEGGFIPHVDHRVPPDVSYENYLYYLQVKREAFGIPEPEGFRERVLKPFERVTGRRI
ncbi:MAG: hypothetical protein ONB23_08380 [candidate division KSB1 bacterium]|nr:hypothetical protein [candidate division KSB1 bacterium]